MQKELHDLRKEIEELKQLRSEDKAVCTFCYGQTIIMQNAIYEAVVDFKRCREMVMTLREGITLSYKDNILTLNLGVYGSGRSPRKVRLEKLDFSGHFIFRNLCKPRRRSFYNKNLQSSWKTTD